VVGVGLGVDGTVAGGVVAGDVVLPLVTGASVEDVAGFIELHPNAPSKDIDRTASGNGLRKLITRGG
jgi:hypothetical protein